jgi:thiamine biosynthesis lipoprotein
MTAPVPPVTAATGQRPFVMSRLRLGFGSFVAIDACAASDTLLACAVTAAFAAVSRVEALMHPTRAGSDLARLRASEPGQSLSIDAWTWQVLKLSQQLHHASDGVFDPCLPGAVGRMSDLKLERPAYVTARVPVQVDLGGIAKGYAVDRAISILRRRGCVSGLVNAGGDLRVFGAEARQVTCRERDGQTSTLWLTQCALASSEADGLSPPVEHCGYYERGRQPPPKHSSARVLARSAAIADALTKCVMLLDEQIAQPLLARLHAVRLQPVDA